MSGGAGSGGTSGPSDSELGELLGPILVAAGRGEPRKVVRSPSAYRTSFPLEQLDLELEDGSRLRLAFKQLGWSTLEQEARLAKPEFLHDPRREPAVYAAALEPAALGSPRYYGSIAEPEEDRHWLFVEWVEGRELYQVGERRLWEAAARWLATAHVTLGRDLARRAGACCLLEYDERYYWRWIERAREFAAAPGRPAALARALEWLASRYGTVVESLLELPKTMIHGEFYASNVLVAGEGPTPRVAPVDWELAASGPGPVDLAALVSGGWGDGDREAIVDAYRSVPGVPRFSARQLAFARLHLAVQWLGWAPAAWQPPEGQRQDWLGEAMQLARGLEL